MRIKLLSIIFLLANSSCIALSIPLSVEEVSSFSNEDSNFARCFPLLKQNLTVVPTRVEEIHRECLGFNKAFKALENFFDSTFQLIQTIPINSTYLIADNLQNIYVATEKGRVIKFDKKGKQQFEYNNNRLGEIGKIDVRNPLTILLYYPDLEVVVILDRTLSPIKELNLFDLDIIEPRGIALANDNNIWVYDEVAAILKKISQTGEILFESRNLNQLTRKNLSPSFLLEKNNLIYLSDLENGLFVFDSFGQLKQEIPVKGITQFQLVGRQLLYKKKNQYFQLSLDTLEEELVELPKIEGTIKNVLINGQLMYIMTKKSTNIYQYNY